MNTTWEQTASWSSVVIIGGAECDDSSEDADEDRSIVIVFGFSSVDFASQSGIIGLLTDYLIKMKIKLGII